MDFVVEGIQFKIGIGDSKETKRDTVVRFLRPLKEELNGKIEGFSYFFEPYLQLDVRVGEKNREAVQKHVEQRVDTSDNLEMLEEPILNPERASKGKTDEDKEALIRGHELSAELAMDILRTKKDSSGRSVDWHARRRLHLFLNQMGLSHLEEADIHLQLIGLSQEEQ